MMKTENQELQALIRPAFMRLDQRSIADVACHTVATRSVFTTSTASKPWVFGISSVSLTRLQRNADHCSGNKSEAVSSRTAAPNFTPSGFYQIHSD